MEGVGLAAGLQTVRAFGRLAWSKFPVAVERKILWSTVFLERKRT
jgi:hypothetical protein